MRYAAAERQALCDLFDDLGPDAPTLCAGWLASDLAAHLVVRERRPDAVPGIMLAPLAGHTAAVQRALTERHGFAGMVRLLRSPGGIWRVPALDEAVNVTELLVHHEDLRRARPGWEPRELDPGLQERIWRMLSRTARVMLRRAPARVVLSGTGGGLAGGGARTGPRVQVSGPPVELLLFCFGRQAHARVELSGDEAAVAGVETARLGI